MDLDLSAFLKAMDVSACWDPSIIRFKRFHVVLGSPSEMSYVHPVHAHLFWHTENPHDWWHCKSEWLAFPWWVCAEITHLHTERGKMHIGFSGGYLKEFVLGLFKTLVVQAKELKEINRNMVAYENITSASPATCRSCQGQYYLHIFIYIELYLCVYISECKLFSI